tara:strand:- start:796 stop:990 length:195 start_codon:yes stop_codon:yes gene_type:complete
MGYLLAHKNCMDSKPRRSEALKIAQQRYRQNHREKVNERQKLWYSQNKELFDSYRKKNKPLISV